MITSTHNGLTDTSDHSETLAVVSTGILIFLGLVDTDWGGTPVEAWSSPDALAKCKKNMDGNFDTQTEYETNLLLHSLIETLTVLKLY